VNRILKSREVASLASVAAMMTAAAVLSGQDTADATAGGKGMNQAPTPAIDASLHEAEPTDRQIVVERTVSATPAECWAKWTSSEGIASFLVPASKIELRIGGAYEIYFLPDAPAGERGSDGCHILSFLPERMLSFEWNAPPQFAEVRQRRSRVVLLFDEAEGGTRAQLTHLGFGAGDEWDQVHAYFSRAWPHVMDAFAESFDK
jgi:uncharacterized protein YndB with AHSA1/START domain